MEILSHIRYGRCFIDYVVHKDCPYCCCECEKKTTCGMQCNPSTYLTVKRLCGNYTDIVDQNNTNLLLMKRTQRTINNMRKVQRNKKVFNK